LYNYNELPEKGTPGHYYTVGAEIIDPEGIGYAKRKD
jgi:hypothetical protein